VGASLIGLNISPCCHVYYHLDMLALQIGDDLAIVDIHLRHGATTA
jgi:hypothetical protein